MLIKRFNGMHLRNKLMFSYFIILALSLTILSSVLFYYSSSLMKKEARQSIIQTMNQSKENLLTGMRDIKDSMLSVHADDTVQHILRQPFPEDKIKLATDTAALENKLLRSGLFGRLMPFMSIYTFDKEYMNDVNQNCIFPSATAKGQVWYEQAISYRGKVYWHINYSSDNISNSSVIASRLMTDTIDPKHYFGVIKGEEDLKLFLDSMDQIVLCKTGKVFLVQDDKIINLRKNKILNELDGDRVFLQTINSSSNGSSFERIAGKQYLIIYDQIELTGWKLVGVVPYNEIITNESIIKSITLLVLIFSILIAFVFCTLISHKISKPIYSLASTMKEFESGTNTILNINSKDEIGMLYDSFNKMVIRINGLIEEVNIKSRREKESELKALQAQIHPHFLYNTLDSINWLAQRYNAKDISLMVNSLGSFLRHSLNKGNEYISIRNELEQVKSYITILEVRFKGKFDVVFELEEEIYPFTIAKLTLQPLVENSINHGFNTIDYKGLITIQGYKDGEYIYLKAIDNGAGADPEMLNDMLECRKFKDENTFNKYGIINVNQRLKLYFDDTCGLHYENNEENGITAILKLKAVKFSKI